MHIYGNLVLGLLMVLAAQTTTAQKLTVGATGNIGLSKISEVYEYAGNTKVKFTISGNAGLFANYKLGAKSSIGAELLWLQMEGKHINPDHIFSILDEQGLFVDASITTKITYHLSYLAMPLHYRFAIGKLGIKAGVQPMIYLFGSSNYEMNGEMNGQPFNSKDKITDVPFDRVDIGPKIGIDYQFNNKFSVRADYYHGLIDITDSGDEYYKRNQQVNIGLSYAFLAK